MAVRIPEPARGKLELLVDNGFKAIGDGIDFFRFGFFSISYEKNVKAMIEVAELHLGVLEDGKRTPKFLRNEKYKNLKNYYGTRGMHCPLGIKDSWLKEEDRMKYLDIRLKISLAMDDTNYIFNDK